MLMLLLIGGAVLGIGMFVLQASIKLFLPRRLGPKVDAFFDELIRWFGRIAVIIFLMLIGLIVWIANTAP